MLNAHDIHRKKFKRSLIGYNKDEVNDFLDQIVQDYVEFELKYRREKPRISVHNIQDKKFKRSLIGYHIEEVNAYLDQIIQDYATRYPSIVSPLKKESRIVTKKLLNNLMKLLAFIACALNLVKVDKWLYWSTSLWGVLLIVSLIHLYRFGKSSNVLFYLVLSIILFIISLSYFILH